MEVKFHLAFNRNHSNSAVMHAAFQKEAVGVIRNFPYFSAHYSDFYRSFVIHRHGNCGDRAVMMLLAAYGHLAPQFSHGGIHRIAEDGDAVRIFWGFRGEAAPQQIAQGFRSIAGTGSLHEGIKGIEKVVVDGDGDALHMRARLLCNTKTRCENGTPFKN